MTPTLRSLRARIAAHAMHAQHDPQETTAKARSSFRQSFYDKTDPSLPEVERQRRADHLFLAHMNRMSKLAAKARQRKAS